MRAGRLRSLALVQRRASTVDGFGQPAELWTTIDTVRCFVDPLNGKEYFAASGEGSKITTRVRLRYKESLSNLSPIDRLSIGGVIYDIESVINVQSMNREYVLMCVVNDRE